MRADTLDTDTLWTVALTTANPTHLNGQRGEPILRFLWRTDRYLLLSEPRRRLPAPASLPR